MDKNTNNNYVHNDIFLNKKKTNNYYYYKLLVNRKINENIFNKCFTAVLVVKNYFIK